MSHHRLQVLPQEREGAAPGALEGDLPPSNAAVDCIVLGYNDMDFDRYARAQRVSERISGAYRDAKHNSVLLGGKRITYMDLINHSIEKATGRNPRLNVFQNPSLGACYLASFLRQRGLKVEILNFFNEEKERFAELLTASPNAVAITTTYYVDPAPIIEITRFVKEHSPSTRVIVGGPHIYNVCGDHDQEMQNFVLRRMGADVYVHDSQGEKTLFNVLRHLRLGRDVDVLASVPNLIYTADGQTFRRTARVPEDNQLDENLVDWSVVSDREEFFDLPIYVRTAVSCPFTCSFCNFPTMAGEHRVASVEVLEKHLRYLHDKGVRYLVFVDDTFNVPLPRFKEILRMMIRNKFDFRWISFFRCSNSDDAAFELMQQSGCMAVFLGIESADETILGYMKKFAKVDKYREGIRKLHEHGIVTFASIIGGFPGETRESLLRSMQFIEETAPTFYNIQLYYHDERTPIAAEAARFGIRGAGYSWKHATMNWRQAADLVDHMYRNIRNSIPLTLYGFSIWSLPYLMQHGISVEQMKQFGTIARELLIQSLDDVPQDTNAIEERLAQVFRGTSSGARARRKLVAERAPVEQRM